jgi:hypothetical protein
MTQVKSKKRLYLMIALVSVLLMWSFCGTNQSQDGGGLTHLHDRPWLTNIPETPKDATNVLVFASEHPIGVSVNGSPYQHMVTMLGHKEKGNKITIEVLQAGKKFTTLARTYECKGPTKDIDLCLELGPRMKKLKFFSSTKWRQGEEGTPSFGVGTLPTQIEAKSLTEVDELTGLGLLHL